MYNLEPNPYSSLSGSPKKIRQAPASQFVSNLGGAREDLQDALFIVKSELNNVNHELTKTKTRYAILQDHMKGKDKFIDELLKSTQYINNAILSGTDPSMPPHL